MGALHFDTWLRLRTELAHAAYCSRMKVLSACDAVEAEELVIGKLKKLLLAIQGIQ